MTRFDEVNTEPGQIQPAVEVSQALPTVTMSTADEIAVSPEHTKMFKSFISDLENLQKQIQQKYVGLLEYAKYVRKDVNAPEDWPLNPECTSFTKPQEPSRLIIPANAGKVTLA